MWHFADGQLKIAKFAVGPLSTNVYVVASPKTGEAVIIDAADEADRIISAVGDLDPFAILTTHGHWDHVQAAAAVAKQLTIPIRIHPLDQAASGIADGVLLRDGEVIRIGEVTLTALHTPGHTPGSTCFFTPGHLFSGDTLFPGGPGATRFPGSSFTQIIESIENKLFVLADETFVYPGHGADTTIGDERSDLAEWVARGW